MQACFQVSVFNGLSDSLQTAINIQNDEAVSAVLCNAEAAYKGGELASDQWLELKSDAYEAGYEFV
jgi:hypothetical protein